MTIDAYLLIIYAMAAPIRVTGAWVQLLADWLDRENLPAPEIRAVLDSHAPSDTVPLPRWQRLLDEAVALRPGKVAPGLEIGALVQPRHVGVLGYLVLVCRNLGEALQVYQRYERLFYGRDMAEVAATDGDVEIRWPGEQSLGALADTVSIAALITFLRRLLDDPPAPSLVAFPFPAPEASAEPAFREFFGCPVRFGDSHNRVRFPAHYLSIPFPHNDPGLRVMLDRQADAMLRALPESDNLDRALQQVIARLLPEASATLPRAAAELHLSSRTLQRRLDARGITWQRLLDRSREQLVRHYLTDPSLALGDIALLLGFSEQSAFTRAYRRWTGTTPGKARREFTTSTHVDH